MGVTSGADEAPMPTFLSKRGSTYYFRRVIPEVLRREFGGRKEMVFSLKTKDRTIAARLCRQEAVQTDALFEEAEAKLAPEVPGPTADANLLSVAQRAARLANSWRRERELYAAQGRLPEFLERVREALRDHEAILRGDFQDAPAGSMDSSEAMVIAARAILTGEGVASLPEVLPRSRSDNQIAPTLNLTDLIDRWSGESKPTEKSIQMWRRTVRDFVLSCGSSEVGKVTKKDVLAYKDQSLAKGASPATVNNRLNQLRSLFRYAVANDLIPADPTSGVKTPNPTRAKDSRTYFDADALKALFGGPVHSSGERPPRGGAEASFWLPLLALFTGARLNELGQLRTKDILLERTASDIDQAVWVIRITEDETDGLRLKTRSSARRVPIHAALKDLGFLRYVEVVRASGEPRLFPALKPDRFGTVTAAWGKWFGAYLRSQNVMDPKIVFHSFRHSFKHYARESGIAKGVNDALTGHESGDVADAYGGPEYPLSPLVEAIERFRVPAFAGLSIAAPNYAPPAHIPGMNEGQ